MRRGDQLRSVFLATLMVLSVVSMSGVGFSGTASAQSNGQFQDVTDDGSLQIWELSVLRLRTNTDDASTLIENQNTVIDTPSFNNVPANRDKLAVYDTGEVELTFSSDSYTSEFYEEDAQLIVASFEKNRKTEEVASMDELSEILELALDGDGDKLREEAKARNITFEMVDESEFEDDGSYGHSYTASEPGPYAVMLARVDDSNGDGFSVDNEGMLTLEGEATIAGVEAFAVQSGASDIDHPDEVAPGDDITVDAKTGLTDGANHSVIVYHEDTFLDSDENTTIRLTEDSIDNLSMDDIVIEHTINSTNGVSNVTGDGTLFGNDVTAQTLSGTTALDVMLDSLGVNPENSDIEIKSVGDTEIDASATVIPNANADESITVETYDNWTTGEYRILHLADNGTVRGFETSTSTISVEEESFFDVTIDDTNSPVNEGEELEVETTIENTGGLEGTQEITLENSDGIVVDSTDVTLSGGEVKHVELAWDTEEGDAGEFNVTVSSEDDSDTETVRIETDPVFNVEITDYDNPGVVDEEITVEYEVENTYFDEDTQDIRFLVNGSNEGTDGDIQLDAGETTTGTFTYDVTGSDKPAINATVASDYDSDSVTIDVVTPGQLKIDELNITDRAFVGDRIPISGLIKNTGDLGDSTDLNLTVNTTDPPETLEETVIRVRGNSDRSLPFSYVPRTNQNLSFTLGIDGETVTENVTVLETEANFEVKDVPKPTISPDSDVTSGDLIQVNATIENTGTESGSQAVGLEWNSTGTSEPTETDTVDVKLDRGESKEVTLEHRLSADREGEDVTFNITTLDEDVEAGTISVQESANFDVSIEDAPTDVTAGNDIKVEAWVNNTGDLEGTQTVRLTLGGETIAKDDIERDGDTNETVVLNAETDSDDVGQGQQLRVRSFDDSDSTTINVNAPAEFDVSVDHVDEPVAGEQLNVTVTVENLGDVAGTQDITLDAGDLGTASESVQRNAGASDNLNLTVDTSEGDAGTYDLLIESDNDTVVNQATVLKPAAIDVSIDSVTDPVRADQDALEVEASVENDGDVSETVDVELRIDDNVETTESGVTVNGSETKTITFDEYEPDTSDVGDLSVNVSAAGASDEESVTVLDALDEATFRVSEFEFTDRTASDDLLRDSGPTVEVSATVENIGDLEGTQDVRFTVDGSSVDSQSVTLDGGETETVTFDVDPTDLRVGNRRLGIASDDSSRDTSVTVRDPQPPTFEVDIEDIGGDLTRDDVVNATVENVGDETGEQTVSFELTIDGEVVNSVEPDVELNRNGETTIELEIPDAPRAGEFEGEFEISSEDETDSADATVDFGTINDGIDAATPGDRIDVAPGTYDTPVTIDTTDVELVGDGAVINVSASETAMTAESNFAEIRGFVFDRADVGVQIDGNDALVRNNRFNSEVTIGINVTGDEATIRNNRFDGNYEGIILDGAEGATITANNIFDATRTGLNSTGGVHVMHNNNVERNTVAIRAAAGQIDATNNWWGRPGGPKDGEILSPVTVAPWNTDPNEDPDYQIVETDLGDIDEVIEGDPSEVTYTIENQGGTAGDTADELVLTLDGTELDRTDAFEIGAGSELDVEAETEFDPLLTDVDSATARSIDSGTLQLSTADDTESKTVDVKTKPEFNVTITDSPDELESDQTLSVDVEIGNEGQAGGDATAELSFDGNAAGSRTITVPGEGTATTTLTRSLSDSDVGTNLLIEVEVGDEVDTATMTVTQAEAEEEEEEEETGGGGGGGGGGATRPPAERPPEVIDPDEIRDSIDVPEDVEPTRAERATIALDEATGQASVTFSEDSSTESITFGDGEGLEGDVTVAEYDSEPESTGRAPGRSVSVTQIEVPDPNRAATIRTRVPVERLEERDVDAEDLNVNRFNEADGEWQRLETELVETTDERVVLEAETPGFSFFAVSATSEPTAAISAPAEVAVDEEFTLDGSESSDEYGEITSYEWALDGETLTGETVSTTLESAGDYELTLTVENDAGETDTETATITVVEDGESTDDGAPDDGSADDGGSIDEPAGFNALWILVLFILVVVVALLYVRYRDEIGGN